MKIKKKQLTHKLLFSVFFFISSSSRYSYFLSSCQAVAFFPSSHHRSDQVAKACRGGKKKKEKSFCSSSGSYRGVVKQVNRSVRSIERAEAVACKTYKHDQLRCNLHSLSPGKKSMHARALSDMWSEIKLRERERA